VKNKQIQQGHCTPNGQIYQLKLPLALETRIDPDSSLYTLVEITERLDYTPLEQQYKRLPSAKEASLKQMFQLCMLGFMEGIYSTRKLEKSCKHDIRFMYLLGGKKAPDHNRFWHFIKWRLTEKVMQSLQSQLIFYLEGAGELDFQNVFIDGTKIEANANKYSFVWRKSISKYEARLETKLDELLLDIGSRYLTGLSDKCEAGDYLSFLSEQVQQQGINFVHGRGKRKSQLQRDIENLLALLERQTRYQSYQKTFKGRNSFSKTDKDATFMRMKDDHMRNGQLKPGYNLQLAVEGEYIVGATVSDHRNDQQTLIPMLEHLTTSLHKPYENIVADSGYESEENYVYLEQSGQTPYIKPSNYERSKKRTFKKNAFIKENMPYDPGTDSYTCPAGDKLKAKYTTKRTSVTGYVSTITCYEASVCNRCPLKTQCTRAKNNRKIMVSKTFLRLRDEAKANITTETGTALRLNRSIQVEGAFGVLKQDYGFRRYLRRGRNNVLKETLMYAFGYNINKFHNKKKRDFDGVIFHQLNSA
jgi:transposase